MVFTAGSVIEFHVNGSTHYKMKLMCVGEDRWCLYSDRSTTWNWSFNSESPNEHEILKYIGLKEFTCNGVRYGRIGKGNVNKEG